MCGGFWILESGQSTETLAVMGELKNEFVRLQTKTSTLRKVLKPGKKF
jgi:hypothetical protein